MNFPHAPILLNVILSAALLASGHQAFAAPGDLDLTFGTGGKVSTDFPNHKADRVTAVAVQADGKILAAGMVNQDGTQVNPGVARYLPNGTLDGSFGTGGKVAADLIGQPSAVLIQPDQKIILAGTSDNQVDGSDFALVRLLSNGQPDPSFGQGGKAIIDLGGQGYSEAALDAALQPDGGIVVAGTLTAPGGSYPDSVVIRCLASGALDGTFGNGGKTIPSLGGIASAYKVAVQGDGKIVVVSNVIPEPSGPEFVALSRFDSTGQADTTFGTGGTVSTVFGSSQPAGISILSDGKILLAGQAVTAQGFTAFLARYQPGGVLDNTFGTGGKSFLTHAANVTELCSSMVVQADGEILLAANRPSTPGFLLMRCRADGSLDTAFGNSGRALTSGNYSGPSYLALQADGKIVLAGTVSDVDFQVNRYEGTPILTPLEVWRQKWFGITANTGNAADGFDFDGDGLPNLLEWATGLNPTAREVSPVAALLNGANLSLTYPLSDAALTAGTTLAVEWTGDLAGPWHTDGVVSSILSDDGTLRQMQAVLPAGTSGRRFLRLKASRP